MKTNVKLLSAVLVLGMFAVITDLQAQGRGRGNAYGHDKHHKKFDSDHHPGKHHRDYDDHHSGNHHSYDHWSSRTWHGNTADRYGRRHVYHRPPHWAHAHGYRSNARYIYYRDYDVYFDCYRGVYITISGRNWVYSQQMPVCMRTCDFRRVAFVELDYFDDDLPWHLERRRSGGWVSISASF